MTKPYNLLTVQEDLILDDVVTSDTELGLRVSGGVVRTQEIPQRFLDLMALKREAQDRQTFKQLTAGDEIERIHVARIPVSLAAHWRSNGFDLTEVIERPNGAQLILERLRREELTAFQLTSRSF